MKRNKIFALFFAIIVSNFVILNNLNMKLFANDITTAICHEPGVIKAFRVLAYVISILKILVPAIIIISGIKSGYTLMITEQDAGGKKLARLIIEKFCIGVFIGFIPLIVEAFMSVVHDYDKTQSKFSDCGACLVSTSKCDSLLATYDK